MYNTDNFQTHIDGRKATIDELADVAFAGFAHFTAMQVRNGCVKGLDLHLARLRLASLEFFGRSMPDTDVLTHLRAAIQNGPAALSLTAVMYSRTGEFTPSSAPNDPAILVRTAPASNGPTGPLRLAVVNHERTLPQVKQVGEAAKTLLLRQAVINGFDDAAFSDPAGVISEGTIWNLAYWDGQAVVWPEAMMLQGVTMGIVRRQLQGLGIPQRSELINHESLKGLKGAVVMNSWTPAVPVSAIGKIELPVSEKFVDLLHEAYQTEPPVAI